MKTIISNFILIVISLLLSGCFATTGDPRTTTTVRFADRPPAIAIESYPQSSSKKHSMHEWLEEERSKIPRWWNPLERVFGRTETYTDKDIRTEERTGCGEESYGLPLGRLRRLLQHNKDVLDEIGVAYNTQNMNEMLDWLNHRESHWKNTLELIEPGNTIKEKPTSTPGVISGITLPDWSTPTRYRFSPKKDEYVIEFYDINKKRWVAITGNSRQISELLNRAKDKSTQISESPSYLEYKGRSGK